MGVAKLGTWTGRCRRRGGSFVIRRFVVARFGTDFPGFRFLEFFFRSPEQLGENLTKLVADHVPVLEPDLWVK